MNHFFVRTKDLERALGFYCDVHGFQVMPRPNFAFPGYWLGVNGRIQVHMGAHDIPDPELHYYGTTPESATDNSGSVDHIAFTATEPDNFARRFEAIGLAARIRYRAEIQLFQVFVMDPDGLTIELNFPNTAVEPRWSTGGGR